MSTFSPGTPATSAHPLMAPTPDRPRPTNGVALTAMIFGIVGGVTGIWSIIPVTGYISAGIAAPLLLVAVICGHIGQYRAKRNGGVGRWQALSAVLLGYIILAFVIITSVVWTFFLFAGAVI